MIRRSHLKMVCQHPALLFYCMFSNTDCTIEYARAAQQQREEEDLEFERGSSR